MVPKSLSVSKPFNTLSEFAQVLYLMITPHLDDFGKLEGDPEVIKALVLPMSNKTVKDFELALSELSNARLIDLYEINDQKVIRQISFEDDQTGLNKRTRSKYPNKDGSSENFQELPRITTLSEENRTEPNRTEFNKSEDKGIGNISDTSYRKFELVNPKTFKPNNDGEVASVDIWRQLEPSNPMAFGTTYLKAYRLGVPVNVMRTFASEIRQSNTQRPGAVFNTKVKDYLNLKKG
jgi:hypothetical protein